MASLGERIGDMVRSKLGYSGLEDHVKTLGKIAEFGTKIPELDYKIPPRPNKESLHILEQYAQLIEHLERTRDYDIVKPIHDVGHAYANVMNLANGGLIGPLIANLKPELWGQQVADMTREIVPAHEAVKKALNQVKYLESSLTASSNLSDKSEIIKTFGVLGEEYDINPNKIGLVDKSALPDHEALRAFYQHRLQGIALDAYSVEKSNPEVFSDFKLMEQFNKLGIDPAALIEENRGYDFMRLERGLPAEYNKQLESIQEGYQDLGEQSEETSGQIEKDWKACASKFGDGFENSFGLVQTGFTNSGGYATTFANTGISAARDMLASMIGTTDGSMAAAYQAYGIEMPGYMLNLASEHDSIMTGLGTTTTAAYKGMIGSAGGFFDQVTYGTNTVLKKLLTGEIGNLDEAWDTLMGGFETAFDDMLGNLTGSLVNWTANSLTNLFKGGMQDIFSGLFNLGTGGNFESALGSVFNFGGNSTGGSLLGDSAGNVASIAGAAKTVAGWLGLGETAAQTTTTYMSWAAQDAAATAAYLESIAPAADFAAINAEIGAAGVESAAAAGETAGAAYSSAFAGAAAIGGAVAVGELLALATGGVGPTEAFTTSIGSFFGERGEGFTPQKAQEFIQADYEYLGRALADTDRANFSLDDIQEAVLEMEKLQEVAGLSDEQLQAMFASLGSVGQAMVEAAEVGTLLNDQALNLIATYDMEVETLNNSEEATRNLTSGLYDLADQISDASGGVIELGDEFAILGDEFVNGEMSGDKLAEALENSINAALQNATKQGQLTAEQMRDLGEQIRSIPTEWVSDVYVNVYERYHDSSEKHSGGLVMHTGGRVPGRDLPGYWAAHERYHGGAVVRTLAPDEVPIIAQRGEFVVRKSSVNSETLPLLKALNQSGQTATAGPALNIQNLVNIEGNLIGNQESFEDLVREIEVKLREVTGSRRAA